MEKEMFYMAFLLLILPVVQGQDGHFRGGSISFSFINDTQIEVRPLLGWTLGLGPCGPGCDKSRVGTSTSLSRAKVLQSTSPYHLGQWFTEVRTLVHKEDITQTVSNSFSERLAGMNEHLKWELESGMFSFALDTRAEEQDIILEGDYWAPINPLQSRKGDPNHSRYHLQIKVDAGRRNDTGKPNSSPVVLFKPEYSIQLNALTEIKLPTMDADGDVVFCSDARFVEAGDLNQMVNVHVERTNCSILINASESSGFTDDGTVAVLIKVMDYNYLPIHISSEPHRTRTPFQLPLSAVPLQFLVRTIKNLQAPMFVAPTPDNNHHFELYAGSRLEIELFAQPHPLSRESLESISVTSIQQLNIHVSDPHPVQGRVKGQVLSWNTTKSDVGTYILQTSPVDTAGINGQERNFLVTIKDVQLVDTMQDLAPMNGSFTCLLNSTCEVPVVFSSGSTVQGVELVNTTLAGVVVSPVRWEGTAYRTDFRVLGSQAGPQYICLKVTGGTGRIAVSCVTLIVIPQDPCMAEPCGHSGQCVSDWDQYTCMCRHGYTGNNCQTEIDYCDSMPCKNGAKCITLPPSAPVQFICTCLPPWSGTVCDIGPSTTLPSTTSTTTKEPSITTTQTTTFTVTPTTPTSITSTVKTSTLTSTTLTVPTTTPTPTASNKPTTTTTTVTFTLSTSGTSTIPTTTPTTTESTVIPKTSTLTTINVTPPSSPTTTFTVTSTLPTSTTTTVTPTTSTLFTVTYIRSPTPTTPTTTETPTPGPSMTKTTAMVKRAKTSTLSTVTATATNTPLMLKTTRQLLQTLKAVLKPPTTPTTVRSTDPPSKPPLLETSIQIPTTGSITKTPEELSTTIPNRIGHINSAESKTLDGGTLLYATDRTTVVNVLKQRDTIDFRYIIISCVVGFVVGFITGVVVTRTCSRRSKKVVPVDRKKDAVHWNNKRN